MYGHRGLHRPDRTERVSRAQPPGRAPEAIAVTLTSHNGREVKTVGDMFLVELPSGLEAAKCAIRIQTVLSKQN